MALSDFAVHTLFWSSHLPGITSLYGTDKVQCFAFPLRSAGYQYGCTRRHCRSSPYNEILPQSRANARLRHDLWWAVRHGWKDDLASRSHSHFSLGCFFTGLTDLTAGNSSRDKSAGKWTAPVYEFFARLTRYEMLDILVNSLKQTGNRCPCSARSRRTPGSCSALPTAKLQLSVLRYTVLETENRTG